ncbi:hypothetical protein K8R33_02420 [archaeon]|nr:hypothetical protein [archaeon]
MNKKGQFYLILAVIISLAVYGVTYTVNSIEEPVLWEDFNDVSENYMTESVFVLNDALEDKVLVREKLDEFTKDFLEYARKRNPNLNLLYVYSDGTSISVKSYLDTRSVVGDEDIFGAGQELVQDVTINVGGTEFIYKVPVVTDNFGEGWSGVTFGDEPFDIAIAGILHPFNLSDDTIPEFKAIIRTEGLPGEYSVGVVGEEYVFLSPGNTQQFVG